MIVRRTWMSCAVAMLALVVFLPAPAAAQPQGPAQGLGQLEVTAVHPDVVNEQLVIQGAHFGRRAGSVSLAGLDRAPSSAGRTPRSSSRCPRFRPAATC